MAATRKDIDRSHKQEYGTCLLSSFAVVCNYFNQNSIESFFKGYYDHYSEYFKQHCICYLWPQFGFSQSAHISILQQSGYQTLFELYSASNIESFSNCRKSFYAEKVSVINGIIQDGTHMNKSLNDFLSDLENESIANIFINNKIIEGDDHPFSALKLHSITVYFDSKFYYHDTNCPEVDQELPGDWWNYENIGDVIIYWK